MASSSSLGSTLIGNSDFTLFSGSLTAVVWRSRGHRFQLEDIFHPVCAGVSNAHSESSAVQSLATLDMEHIRSTRAGGSLLAFENLRSASACWLVCKCRRVRPARIARSVAILLDSAGVGRFPAPQKMSTSSGETLSGPQIGPSSQCGCDSGRGRGGAAAVEDDDGSRGLIASMGKTSSSSSGAWTDTGTESGREAESSSVLTVGASPQSEGGVGEGDMVSSVEVEGGLKGTGKGAVEATLCSRSEPRVDQASSGWDSSLSCLMVGEASSGTTAA